MSLFMGLDVGGTGTRCLICREDGKAVSYGEAGPGSHEVVGYDGLKRALAKASGMALDKAGIKARDIAGLGAGMAGYDWPSDRAKNLEVLRSLGTKGPIVIKNDAALGLAAMANEGINLSSGTSNNCYGYWKGREGRLAGAGFLAGEEGGGLEAAILAVRAVNHARIKRILPTSLSKKLVEQAGFDSADSFIEAIGRGQLFPKAEWAPLIFSEAADGDSVAMGIVQRCGEELGFSALAVLNQLGMDSFFLPQTFPVVLSGSLFRLKPPLAKIVERTLMAHAPCAAHLKLIELAAPPVCGAIVFVMNELGMNTDELRPNLLESASAINTKTGDE